MARKTNNPSTNYFNKIVISSASFAPINPDVILGPFPIAQLTFQNEGPGVIEYSFDGTLVHGDSDPAKASANLTFPNRQVCTVWFRLKSGGATTIRIEAYAL